MGSWGAGIFADDTACDVRDDWRDLAASAGDPAHATDRLLLQWRDSLEDPDEGPVFWLALAAAQLATGRLQERVKQAALSVIDTGAGLRRWQQSPKLLRQRQVVLAKLRAQLLGPQKAPTIIRPWKPPVASFPAGEVFSYRLDTGVLVLLRVYEVVTEASGGTCAWLEVLDFAGTEVPAALDLAALPGRLSSRSNFFTQSYVLVEGPRTHLDPSRVQLLANGLPFCPPPPDHRPLKAYSWAKVFPDLLLRDTEEAQRGGRQERDRSLSARDARFYLERARAYRARGRLPECIREFTQALALDDQLPQAFSERGLAHLTLREYQQAVDDCTAALERSGAQHPLVRLARALANAKLGHSEEARAEVTAVERMQSRSTEVRTRIAEVLTVLQELGQE